MGFIVSNARFRGAWISRVGNAPLAAAISRYIDHVQAVRLKTLHSAMVRQDAVDRMREIYRAFEGAASDEVSRLIDTHVQMAAGFFRAHAEA
jgi:DNA-binding GntR family transcriptional regulator